MYTFNLKMYKLSSNMISLFEENFTNIFYLVYAEFEGDECNSLDFQLGTNAIDATLPTNRGWNIKVSEVK